MAMSSSMLFIMMDIFTAVAIVDDILANVKSQTQSIEDFDRSRRIVEDLWKASHASNTCNLHPFISIFSPTIGLCVFGYYFILKILKRVVYIDLI